MLATCVDVSIRDGKRSVAEATRACEITAWKDANCPDTLAAAYAEAGDFVTSINWQKQAIAIARSNGPLLSARDSTMEKRLALYERKQPCPE